MRDGRSGTTTIPQSIDVLVLGGGNAAMCAALSARSEGAEVLVLEGAPEHFRGGNSRHTRDVRYMHTRKNAYVTGLYHEDEFWDDLIRVTGGRTNEALARQTIRLSEDLDEWMAEHGVKWQRPLRGTLHLARTNLFMLGGGRGMMNGYYETARRMGIHVLYNALVQELAIKDGVFDHAVVMLEGERREISAKAVVTAAGGFEANIEWLKRYWGNDADNFIIRGTPYNTGAVLASLLEMGAATNGDPKEFHAVAVDGRAPKFDGGIVTRLDSVPFGIVVNRDGERFYDEGEDFWPKRYAIWGGLIARQPDQVAYSIIDADVIDKFMPSVFHPVEAPTVAGLAEKLGVDPVAAVAAVDKYNASIVPGTFDPGELDDCHTQGLTPPKSHWAVPIRKPPFYGYPLRPGITFTYMGVTVDDRARIMMHNGQPSANMTAAGELMAGNILGKGYLAGFGLTIGAVFGRIAGKEAAHSARR
ncbi:MAG: FAD-dependent tricarballylate dehydrogenase TcuA [Chloroflexota bacterium]